MEQPEEKAKELVQKFRAYSMTYFDEVEGIFDEESEIKNAKQCALIAVDEIIKSKPSFDFWDSSTGTERRPNESFWESVKSEIKLI